MYRCQILNKISRSGEKLNKIVVVTRPKTYTHWDEEAEENWTSIGFEIVREINASQSGLDLWDSWSEDERAAFLKRMS